jgi:hypothetical protein
VLGVSNDADADDADANDADANADADADADDADGVDDFHSNEHMSFSPVNTGDHEEELEHAGNVCFSFVFPYVCLFHLGQ